MRTEKAALRLQPLSCAFNSCPAPSIAVLRLQPLTARPCTAASAPAGTPRPALAPPENWAAGVQRILIKIPVGLQAEEEQSVTLAWFGGHMPVSAGPKGAKALWQRGVQPFRGVLQATGSAGGWVSFPLFVGASGQVPLAVAAWAAFGACKAW